MRLRILAVSAALLVSTAGAPVPAAGPGLDPRDLAAAALTGEPVVVTLPGLGRVALRLRPNPLARPGAATTITDARGVARAAKPEWFLTLAGRVDGDEESVVRLTVTRGWVSGFVASRARVVEIAPDDWARPTRTVVRDPSAEPVESLPPARDLVVEAPAVAARTMSHGPLEVNVLGVGNCARGCGELTALVLLDGDVFFRNIDPGTCVARQNAILNDVDGIYAMAATRIRLRVSQTNCRTSADLGPSGTDAGTYLDALRDAWRSTGSDRSLVFLSVGYSFPCSPTSCTIGIAYRSGVCARFEPDPPLPLAQRCSDGYSLGQMTGSISTAFLRAKLAAHEIGHNFSATHGNASGCSSSSSGTGTIMCPTIQYSGPNTFSAANATEIRSHAESTIGYVARI